VAGALAAGGRVADISDEFGVSRETVRSQVKQVLDKAGARSQSDFIRLVSTEAVRLVRAAATGSST
jgi:DNA-binding NarL/FixJ family response regulator